MGITYYYLHLKDDDGRVARSSIDYNYPEYEGSDSPDFLFEIDGDAQDYLANDLAWPLMSEKMADQIREATDSVGVKWVTVRLLTPNGKHTFYLIPVFRCDVDVLDFEKSVFSKGNFIVKAHLSLEKINGLRFFNIPGSTFRLVVDKALKEKLEASDLSGLDFSRCPAS